MVHGIVGGAIRAMIFVFTLVALFAAVPSPVAASRIFDDAEKHNNLPVPEGLFRKSAIQKNHGSYNEDPDADTDTDVDVDFNYTIPDREDFENFWDTMTPDVENVSVTFGFDFAWDEGETPNIHDVPGTDGCLIFRGEPFVSKVLSYVSQHLFYDTTLRPLDLDHALVTDVTGVHSTCLVTLQYLSPIADVKHWDAAFATISDEEDVTSLREDFISGVLHQVFNHSANGDSSQVALYENSLLAVRVVKVGDNFTAVSSISVTPTSSETPSQSYTPSETASYSETASHSESFTASLTASSSESLTASQTASSSETQTSSQTPTTSVSETASESASYSETASHSTSETESASHSMSITATYTPSNTASATGSLSEGASISSSPSNTRSSTPSSSEW
jgi:hypothetical protein